MQEYVLVDAVIVLIESSTVSAIKQAIIHTQKGEKVMLDFKL